MVKLIIPVTLLLSIDFFFFDVIEFLAKDYERGRIYFASEFEGIFHCFRKDMVA